MSRISTVHSGATLRPGKLELIANWLPGQPWFEGNAATARIVGNFRFEDPAGEVGLESILLEGDGQVYYVPVSWRASALPAWARLIGELQHSGLGKRYCYDATTDPVFLQELYRVIAQGDTQAEIRTVDGEVRPASVQVRGNAVTPSKNLHVVHRLGTYYPGAGKLIAKWSLDGVAREDVLAAG